VKNLPFKAGKISTRIRVRNPSVAGANGWLIFARRNSANFRFVQLRPGKVLIGQQGTVGGVTFRTVSRNVAAVKVGSWTELRADIYPDGFVQVYLGGKKVASAKFAAAVEGGVGVRAVRAKTSFDWFRLDDATLLPPRPQGLGPLLDYQPR
jgi:hypothetical protein